MRGTLVSPDLVLSVVGIIPACAGNTGCREPCASRAGDHPRVCGEHLAIPRPSFPLMGSSPRVRGTLAQASDGVLQVGIIPACAGNTTKAPARYDRRWDHPRVCGEHGVGSPAVVLPLGSSPRVRGTRRGVAQGPHGPGIIPACAGNTRLQRREHEVVRDHPRVCGEHSGGVSHVAQLTGSSPRVRGTPLRSAPPLSERGIIPACAGNTSSP